MIMFEKEFKYYVNKQKELVSKHDGKVIIIKGERVIEVFDSISEAYFFAQENDLLGKVMIQLVGPGVESYTTTFNSSLVFA